MSKSDFQISVELTNLIPTRTISNFTNWTVSKVIEHAHALKRTNSDIIVEDDLTQVFGRALIENKITQQFKNGVGPARPPFPLNDALELRQGRGESLSKALQNENDGRLNTIIQLSLLSAMHDRLSLASALDYGLNERVKSDYKEARSSPGYAGIAGTLQAISSQTPTSMWSQYVHIVRERLLPVVGSLPLQDYGAKLPANLLFACLDSLYLIQRWPDEYRLTISEPVGCVTLIIWAHYLLGIPVVVRNRDSKEDLLFSNDQSMSPNIIVHHTFHIRSRPEICLLGKTDDDIHIRIPPDAAQHVTIEARERVPLAGYSTIHICRAYSNPFSWCYSQEFQDAAHFSVAIAMALSKRLVSDVIGVPLSIERWRIWEAADVLFNHMPFNHALAEKFADNIPPHLRVKDYHSEILPGALDAYLKKCNDGSTILTLGVVATDIIVMATVSGVASCAKLPLIAEDSYTDQGYLQEKLLRCKETVEVGPCDFFNHVLWRLIGPDPVQSHLAVEECQRDVFLASAFGWTVYLSTFAAGDGDVSHVDPQRIYIVEGVPTSKKTGDEKSFGRDATHPSIELIADGSIGAEAANAIVDNSVPSFKSRCISAVQQRSEYYGSGNDSFHLILKFLGTHLEPASSSEAPRSFMIQQSYRSFHENLWRVHRIQKCGCSPKEDAIPEDVRLPIEAATAAGNWAWHKLERPKARGIYGRVERILPERIIIVLVHGDPRARWLAVGAASDATETRQTLLRGLGCCVSCAIEDVIKRDGKWFLII